MCAATVSIGQCCPCWLVFIQVSLLFSFGLLFGIPALNNSDLPSHQHSVIDCGLSARHSVAGEAFNP